MNTEIDQDIMAMTSLLHKYCVCYTRITLLCYYEPRHAKHGSVVSDVFISYIIVKIWVYSYLPRNPNPLPGLIIHTHIDGSRAQIVSLVISQTSTNQSG